MLEVLREPLEAGQIVVSRAARRAEFPARFQLIAAMNLCPCVMTWAMLPAATARIFGLLLDRIGLYVEVPRPPREVLRPDSSADGEFSHAIAARVAAAHLRQLARSGKCNARLTTREVNHHRIPETAGRQLLERAMERLGLSARGYHRVLKVAGRIADLTDSDTILNAHIAEAIVYRVLDRKTAAA